LWLKNNAAKAAQYARNFRQRHRDRINKEAYDKILATRPPKPEKCTACDSNRIRWSNGAWECADCCRISAEKRSVERNRIEQINERYQCLIPLYGQKAADIYRGHAIKHPYKLRYGPQTIHRLCLPRDYQKLSEANLERIYTLNVLLKLPFGNIGWTCQKCGVYSGEFAFFDIDHISPRLKGGHGKKDNLQVLCPNCHRKKTLLDVFNRTICHTELLSIHTPEPRATYPAPTVRPLSHTSREPSQQHPISGQNHVPPRPPSVSLEAIA